MSQTPITPAFEQDGLRVYQGDCIEVMQALPAGIARTCVTSPPYWGLRDYGVDGQLGLEATPAGYVANMVNVFREVKRVLRDDGTLWLNIGDSYAANWSSCRSQGGGGFKDVERTRNKYAPPGTKPKDLVGIPWMLAFALRADGWYLRQDIIWHKPNPMPESVTDRCTKSHEYIFLLTKADRYYFDQESILEPSSPNTHARLAQNVAEQIGSYRANGGGKTNGPMKAVARAGKYASPDENDRAGSSFKEAAVLLTENRNKRSVWTVTTKPYKEAHFATFPPELITPCILAGSAPGDVVLDPFNGSGTTGHVCREHGRQYVGVELNPAYVELTRRRFVQPLLFQPVGGPS